MNDGPLVEKGLPPPLTQVAWSPEIVAQSLEILPLLRDPGGIGWLKPVHAVSLRVGTSPSRQPADIVIASLARYGLSPTVVHSTSWRTEGDRMILTYVAIVDGYLPPPDPPLAVLRVGRADLARGEATAAPPVIAIDQVIEHALRHLSWLCADDPAIADALADWKPLLAGYVPEPFRAFRT